MSQAAVAQRPAPAQDLPPSLAERYGRATETNDLSVSSRRGGDADLLIVSGWESQEKGERIIIGYMLWRVMREFDKVRSDMKRARDHWQAANAEAARLLRSKAPDRSEVADRLVMQARSQATTEYQLIQSQIKSLPKLEERVGRWAQIHATHRRLTVPDHVVGLLACRALDGVLDERCPKCTGTMFTGGYDGAPSMRCPACLHTGGKRSERLGRGREECAFALEVQSFLRGAVAAAKTRLQRRLARG